LALKVSKIKRPGWTALVPLLQDPVGPEQVFYPDNLPAVLGLLRKREREFLLSFLAGETPVRTDSSTDQQHRTRRLLSVVVSRLRQNDCRRLLSQPPATN
jgi:hypothetical protein